MQNTKKVRQKLRLHFKQICQKMELYILVSLLVCEQFVDSLPEDKSNNHSFRLSGTKMHQLASSPNIFFLCVLIMLSPFKINSVMTLSLSVENKNLVRKSRLKVRWNHLPLLKYIKRSNSSYVFLF